MSKTSVKVKLLGVDGSAYNILGLLSIMPMGMNGIGTLPKKVLIYQIYYNS